MDSYRLTDRTSVLYSKILDDNYEESDLTRESKREKPLVQLEVELENGNKVYLTPHPEDQPFELASRFCQEHRLEAEMISLLADSIQKSMEYSQLEEQKKDSRVQILTEPCESLIIEPYPLSCKATNHNQSNGNYSKKHSRKYLNDLYMKGVKFNQQHRIWIEQQRKEKENAEAKQCTYIPRINQLSKSIANQRSLSRIKTQKQEYTRRQNTEGSEQNHSRCISSSVILTDLARDDLIRQRRSCQLKPRDINQKYNEDVFETLYQNKKSSQAKQLKIIEESHREETHHPNINPISREIVGSKSFTERLACYQLQRQKKKAKQKNRQQKQNLYKPKTNPGPPNRNCEKLPIGEFLYRNRKKKAPMVMKPAPVPIICQTSKKIYEQRKQQAYRRIFYHLAANDQEVVCWQRLQLDKIDESVLPVLFPLLEEIHIMQIDLDYPDFRTALNFLFGTLSPNEKNILLNFGQEKNTSQIPDTSKPQMSKKSRELLRHMKRGSMNIYDYCELREALKDQQIESRRISRERIEMEQCTFQPKIDKKPSYF